jgi:hypothetical protein
MTAQLAGPDELIVEARVLKFHAVAEGPPHISCQACLEAQAASARGGAIPRGLIGAWIGADEIGEACLEPDEAGAQRQRAVDTKLRKRPEAAGKLGTRADVKDPAGDTEAQPELGAAFNIMSIPTLMIFREQVLIFSQPGALPAPALTDLIEKVRALDMAAVHAEIAKQQADAPAV